MSRIVAGLAVLSILAGGLAACGSSEPAEEKAAALPDDVTAFTARAGECRSWSDEARANGPNADATHAQVMAAWTENACETLGADAGALRTTYADNPAALAAIETAMTPVETDGAQPASSAAPAAATPATGEAGLSRFIEKAETCAHIAGEAGDDPDINAQLNQTWAETGCEFLEAETRATRQAYAGNAEVLGRVAAAVEPLGY